ncbi:MAG TPA: cytochrome c3 family protein [Polyangiaceae bacterium]|nr:cytochrome c3 family protein [Polyangiaceae bacterium]
MSAAVERERLATIALLLCVLVAAVLAACHAPATVARFPHREHLTGIACGTPGKPACLSCNSCHAPSEQERELKLPKAELCESCHRNDRSKVLSVLSVIPERPYGEILMNHDKHLAMPEINGQCVPCHSGVIRSGSSTLPPMSQCFTCHEHQKQWDAGQCAPCHAMRDLARTLPQTFMRHGAEFARSHGSEAAQKPQLCQSCHTQASCQACHDVSQKLGVEARRPELVESQQVHRGDFLVRHALEAASQPSRCSSCHTPQSCDSCHRQRGVSGALASAVNPHPPEWIGTNTASSHFHGLAARRDIAACAACHDQGPSTNCIRCHKVGAYGGSPHPPGFRSSQSLASEMCRYCHG